MPRRKKTTEEKNETGFRPALTPEAQESRMISLAVDLAEKQLLEGTASSQIISHYLKLATVREKKELEILDKQSQLIDAKIKNLGSDQELKDLYSNAIKAFCSYNGQEETEDDEDAEY